MTQGQSLEERTRRLFEDLARFQAEYFGDRRSRRSRNRRKRRNRRKNGR